MALLWKNEIPNTLTGQAAQLYDELNRATRFYRRGARLNSFMSLALAVVAITASLLIAVGGVLFDVSNKILGVAALLPAFAIFINNVMQPHERAGWCYKKKDKLNALRRRLLYEAAPEVVSA